MTPAKPRCKIRIVYNVLSAVGVSVTLAGLYLILGLSWTILGAGIALLIAAELGGAAAIRKGKQNVSR